MCCICGEKLTGRHLQNDVGPVCTLCSRAAPAFEKAVAFGSYDGVLCDLIHVLKYQQVKTAARTLALFLNGALASQPLPQSLIAIPIPLAAGKRRQRGFNQAEEIARHLASCRSAATRIQLDGGSLVRKRETASQTGLTRHQRRANVRGAFAVRHSEKIKGRSVLLVDDVMTTGATANECARVLRSAGAAQVYVATVARATREVSAGLKTLAAAGT